MLIAMMFEAFTPEHTLAAFHWVDDELGALPANSAFTSWWAPQVEALSSRLPSNMTEGKIPRALPDHFKADLSRYVLLQEVFHELTNGPPGGTEITAGGSDGTLPHLEGGWGMTPEGGYGRADDVLRWLRGWQNEMLSDLGGMIAGVQTATGADDVEIAPGVRMRVKPEALSRLLQMPDTPNAWT